MTQCPLEALVDALQEGHAGLLPTQVTDLVPDVVPCAAMRVTQDHDLALIGEVEGLRMPHLLNERHGSKMSAKASCVAAADALARVPRHCALTWKLYTRLTLNRFSSQARKPHPSYTLRFELTPRTIHCDRPLMQPFPLPPAGLP